ncbi:helix-turn-helix domain-containing protein [Planotetraspora sp. A-T 1434]|uniref:helix-turn-helix domain-containing protein n=1 Tax=Planotetraspora sp. A-T 1434 TaxID=2979219 RepID=UPI0021BF6027|nr:helix-turn-helix domain-containing protein [Planotetraspora sp. A-T 1434]MCT9933267.1 helix-turn-helix domain-containing protein [Planotetraspora sp. A-T 1434]
MSPILAIIGYMMTAESAQTLERGLRLLRLLADGHRGRTPTELAHELGVSRPAVYRLITTLQNEGFVRRDADGRVHLGFGVLVLAQAVQPLLRAAALPALRALAERAGATAHLTVAEGDEGLAVAVVEPSWTDFHVAYREGSRHPLTRGAAGLAVLALRSGEGRPSLHQSKDQLQEGARGIAAPIRGLPWLEASVGVVSFSDLDVESVGPLVLYAAEELAVALAHPRHSQIDP